ncbi:MAG: hypothetical protein FWG41_04175 [Methanomassiliicoccaceae archaeon]|nr:hypothetical protein [Methanomassiliicoccaceae archaeon]
MRPLSERGWLIIAAVSAAAALISAAVMAFSISEGDTGLTAVSGTAFAALALCSVLAWTIRKKVSGIGSTPEEVSCMRLKRPGIERPEEEIVPKGKVPKE